MDMPSSRKQSSPMMVKKLKANMAIKIEHDRRLRPCSKKQDSSTVKKQKAFSKKTGKITPQKCTGN